MRVAAQRAVVRQAAAQQLARQQAMRNPRPVGRSNDLIIPPGPQPTPQRAPTPTTPFTPPAGTAQYYRPADLRYQQQLAARNAARQEANQMAVQQRAARIAGRVAQAQAQGRAA